MASIDFNEMSVKEYIEDLYKYIDRLNTKINTLVLENTLRRQEYGNIDERVFELEHTITPSSNIAIEDLYYKLGWKHPLYPNASKPRNA